MKRMTLMLILLLGCMMLMSCAPNAPNVKRSGYKRVNPEHLYTQDTPKKSASVNLKK